MRRLHIQLANQKYIRISGIDRLFTACLQELPHILELRDGSAVHTRLHPPPTADDEAINHDWQESVEPELHHLFVSAAETITRDLILLKPNSRQPGFHSVTFPSTHLTAWMSALNQARLILAARSNVDEIDLNLPYLQLSQEKIVPVIQINVYGELLGRFVQRELGAGRRQNRKASSRKRKTRKTKP